jgi:hypothetical protein
MPHSQKTSVPITDRLWRNSKFFGSLVYKFFRPQLAAQPHFSSPDYISQRMRIWQYIYDAAKKFPLASKIIRLCYIGGCP